MRIISISAILLALILSFITPHQAKAADANMIGARFHYNYSLVSDGIGVYYAENSAFPSSLTQLIQEGFVPSNLINAYTEQQITGDSDQPDDMSITPDGSNAIVFTYYKSDHQVTFRLDTEMMSGTTMGLTHQESMDLLYIYWGIDSLKAYQVLTGNVATSFYDLSDNGFWPYENAKNNYTGMDLQFQSNNLGDMKWDFKPNGTILVHLWLPTNPGATSTSKGFVFPMS